MCLMSYLSYIGIWINAKANGKHQTFLSNRWILNYFNIISIIMFIWMRSIDCYNSISISFHIINKIHALISNGLNWLNSVPNSIKLIKCGFWFATHLIIIKDISHTNYGPVHLAMTWWRCPYWMSYEFLFIFEYINFVLIELTIACEMIKMW